MFRRAGIGNADAAGLDELMLPAAGSGDADESWDGARPEFDVRLRGYDRLQVDNYVARTEWELRSARLEADHLLDRFGACAAELEICRRAVAPAGEQDARAVPERIAEILQAATDEASQVVGAAGEEADRILAEARIEADARLAKVKAMTEVALAGLAAVEEELADLQRQRDEARCSLRQLTDQIGQVLQTVDPAGLASADRAEATC